MYTMAKKKKKRQNDVTYFSVNKKTQLLPLLIKEQVVGLEHNKNTVGDMNWNLYSLGIASFRIQELVPLDWFLHSHR